MRLQGKQRETKIEPEIEAEREAETERQSNKYRNRNTEIEIDRVRRLLTKLSHHSYIINKERRVLPCPCNQCVAVRAERDLRDTTDVVTDHAKSTAGVVLFRLQC